MKKERKAYPRRRQHLRGRPVPHTKEVHQGKRWDMGGPRGKGWQSKDTNGKEG